MKAAKAKLSRCKTYIDAKMNEEKWQSVRQRTGKNELATEYAVSRTFYSVFFNLKNHTITTKHPKFRRGK